MQTNRILRLKERFVETGQRGKGMGLVFANGNSVANAMANELGTNAVSCNDNPHSISQLKGKLSPFRRFSPNKRVVITLERAAGPNRIIVNRIAEKHFSSILEQNEYEDALWVANKDPHFLNCRTLKQALDAPNGGCPPRGDCVHPGTHHCVFGYCRPIK